ncbi:MAG: gamma-glutamyl-gamma-aminobutyrate hydrolase family protein [Nitrospirota bacterium]
MKRHIVGITGDMERGEGSVRMAYADAVHKAGAHPVLLLPNPAKDKIKKISRAIDALLIPGGRDIKPAFYGGKNPPLPPFAKGGEGGLNLVSDKRFNFEKALLKEVMIFKKPVLGICYGMQFLNVICGGTLYIDLPSRKSNPVNHDAGHIIELYNRSKLYYILGIRELVVNSTHHQGIKKLGKELTASACSQDNLIEAIEMRDYPYFIGVQWHPERLSDKYSGKLFKSFVSSIKVKGAK